MDNSAKFEEIREWDGWKDRQKAQNIMPLAAAATGTPPKKQKQIIFMCSQYAHICFICPSKNKNKINILTEN